MFFKMRTSIDPIYLITTATDYKYDEMLGGYDFTGLRTVGFKHDLDDAIEIVDKNIGDIWETIYDYAIIEEIYPGLYPTVEKKWYYYWDTVKRRYVAKDLVENPPVNSLISLVVG